MLGLIRNIVVGIWRISFLIFVKLMIIRDLIFLE